MPLAGRSATFSIRNKTSSDDIRTAPPVGPAEGLGVTGIETEEVVAVLKAGAVVSTPMVPSCGSAGFTVPRLASPECEPVTSVEHGAAARIHSGDHWQIGNAHEPKLAGEELRLVSALLLRKSADLVLACIIDCHLAVDVDSQTPRAGEIRVPDIVLRTNRSGHS